MAAAELQMLRVLDSLVSGVWRPISTLCTWRLQPMRARDLHSARLKVRLHGVPFGKARHLFVHEQRVPTNSTLMGCQELPLACNTPKPTGLQYTKARGLLLGVP